MKAIEEPPAEFESLLDMFEKTLGHEKSVTRSIVVDLAIKRSRHKHLSSLVRD